MPCILLKTDAANVAEAASVFSSFSNQWTVDLYRYFQSSGAFITKREIWPSGTVYRQLDKTGANMNYREEYELEIDLRDLFFDIVYQWRIILLAAVILAVAAGAYAVRSNIVSQSKEALMAKEQGGILAKQYEQISIRSTEVIRLLLAWSRSDQNRYKG